MTNNNTISDTNGHYLNQVSNVTVNKSRQLPCQEQTEPFPVLSVETGSKASNTKGQETIRGLTRKKKYFYVVAVVFKQ